MKFLSVQKKSGFLLLLTVLLLITACASPDSGVETDISLSAETDTIASEPVESNEESTPVAEVPIIPTDPLAIVADYWSHGDFARARIAFWNADVRELEESPRHDEWALWRGRLYLRSWEGAFFGLAGENVSAILSDIDDVWMGTWTGGLSRYSLPAGAIDLWDPGMPSKAVRTVNRIRRNGDIINIVRYGELLSYSTRTSRWQAETDLPVHVRLQDYLVSGSDEYLASLGDGLWVRRGGAWERIQTPGLFINRIESLSEEEILIATMDRGFYVYNLADGSWDRPENSELRYANITSITGRDHLIFGGTYGDGAFVWDRKTGETKIFGQEILGDPWVLSVEIRGPWIYFATFGAGLNSWNIETGEWDRISIAEGFPTGDIASLAVAEDNAIWAGTLGGGIVRIEEGVHGN